MNQELLNKTWVQQDFNRAAPDYEEYASLQLEVAKALITHARTLFPEGTSLLDIGAGTGFNAQLSDSRWNLTQLDIAYAMCQRSSQWAPTVNADMEHLPFPAQHFDGVISSLSFQWAQDLKRTLEEMYRVTRKGGQVIYTLFGSETLRELQTVLDRLNIEHRSNQFIGQDALIDLMEQCKFKQVECTCKRHVRQYESAQLLLRYMKQIGAANKFETRSTPLTKLQLEELDTCYKYAFETLGTIPATWDVLTVTAKR